MTGSGDSRRADVLVVGSGVAGLTLALDAARRGAAVTIVTKDDLGTSTSELAQGGIAAVLEDTEEDSFEVHLDDTLRAGAELCDEEAVRLLVESAPDAIAALLDEGASFDRDVAGRLALSREGGHRGARVVHAGGAATGAEVVRALRSRARDEGIDVLEDVTVTELVLEKGRCIGIRLLPPSGPTRELAARAVVLATGGAGQCFALTTNPLGATADGVAIALRAGAAVADLEFVQFHPTALATATLPRPLLSEALRGDGAVLVDASGARFVDELAPRDAVSRAIAERCAAEGTDHVYLDARSVAGFEERFPTLSAILGRAGLSARTDLLPVAPAAHYLCGGVLTDLEGRTSIEGLFAVGEVACTGVHGANRLASNSLLEGLVFARRCAEALTGGAAAAGRGALAGLAGRGPALAVETFAFEPPSVAARPARGATASVRERLQQVMSEGAGVRRSAESLELARKQLRDLASEHLDAAPTRAGVELENLLLVSLALVESAERRRESRGSHTRLDHLRRDDRLRMRFAPRLEGARRLP